MDKRTIQQQLQEGMTIKEACTLYDLSFKELLSLMQSIKPKKTYKTTGNMSTGYKYVTQIANGRFILRRHRKHFGTYKTLEDAIKIRDWFMYNRWDKRWVDRACKECKVERCKQ